MKLWLVDSRSHGTSFMHEPVDPADPIPSVIEVRDEPANLPPSVIEVPVPRGHPLIAWFFILLIVSGTVLLANRRPSALKAAESKDNAALIAQELQARYLVGVTQLVGKSNPSLYENAKMLDVGPLPQRLRFVALVGELSGPEAAQQQLQRLEDLIARSDASPSQDQFATMKTLRRLYADYIQGLLDAPSLSPEDRRLLREELDWFGELALAPQGGPNTSAREALLHGALVTAISLGAVATVAGLVGLIGLFGLILFGALFFGGVLKRGFSGQSMAHGVYAETFAVWLVLFMVLSLAASFVRSDREQLLIAGGAMLCSLAALLWPLLRGIPWRQVRTDVGLTAGRRPWLEPVCGIGSYVTALPMLVVGLFLTLGLMKLQQLLHGGISPHDSFAPPPTPHHPIVEFITGPNWWLRLQVLFVASFVAPVVEETMFRGVLYRHLRDGTRGLGFGLSFLFSALLNCFIFAVIHPQGVVAVPALMSLAFAFTLAREWRGSLVPAMVAHGINNGVLLLTVILAFGG
jgi:membrane protease YdiL (CAAX protease family)